MFKRINEKIVINDKITNRIGKTIAIGSGKGGVGKSTVASNLAIAIAKQGYSVGLIDADVYGPSQPKMLGSEHKLADIDPATKRITPLSAHGIKFISIATLIDHTQPLILRAPIVIKLIHSLLNDVNWGTLDFLLIDLPPGTGDVQLTIAQNAKLDAAIIVTTPQEVAIDVARKGLEMLQRVNVLILGIVENMAGFVCNHCHEINHIAAENKVAAFADKYSVPIIARIPLHRAIADAGDHGLPIPASSQTQISSSETMVCVAAFTAIADQCVAFNNNAINGSQYFNNFAISKDNSHLLLTWIDPDTNQSTTKNISAYDLRLACKCALCINNTAAYSKNLECSISITKLKEVGRYGLNVTFSDQHSSGIYTFAALRDL